MIIIYFFFLTSLIAMILYIFTIAYLLGSRASNDLYYYTKSSAYNIYPSRYALLRIGGFHAGGLSVRTIAAALTQCTVIIILLPSLLLVIAFCPHVGENEILNASAINCDPCCHTSRSSPMCFDGLHALV